MKRFVYVILMLALSTLIFTSCGPAETSGPINSNENQQQSQKEVLKVALDACYPPMEYLENDEIVGFSAALAKALAKEMNAEVELKNIGWDEIFDNLYAKQYDMILSSVTINDERKETMLFSDSYFTSTPTILTVKSANINSAQDLSGKKVAVQADTTAYDIITKNIAGVDIKTFDSAEAALLSFENKEADAVVIDAPVIFDYAKQKNNPDYVVVQDTNAFSQEEFGIAVNKDNPALVDKLNTALKAIKANGEYDKVFNTYFKNN